MEPTYGQDVAEAQAAFGEDAAGQQEDVLGMLSEQLTEPFVRNLLKEVIDPELGVNIVDLGLVYEILISEDTGKIVVNMTLTTPGCPLSGYMDDEIHGQLEQLPKVRDVQVNIIWEPPWDPEMMSDDGKQMLGWG